jgi:hypothetical protein
MKTGDAVDKQNFKSIHGIFFFGVPNQGIIVEQWIRMAKGQPNEYLLQTLGLRSTYLKRVHEEFQDAFRNLPNSEIVAVYETEETRLPKVITR